MMDLFGFADPSDVEEVRYQRLDRPLREYQSKALDELRAAIKAGERRIVLQLPTGGGKTRIAGQIIEGAMAKRNKTIFTVPTISLIDQTVASFSADGLDRLGVMQAKHPLTNPSRPIQIASVQTLSKRDIPEAAIVIVDECHIQFDFIRQWLAKPEMADIPVIGLTATPWSKGLGQTYNTLIVAETIAGLTAKGFLAPFQVFAPSHPDLKGVKVVAGDYHEGQLATAMNKPKLVADVVETWRARGQDRPTFVFAVDRAHAAALQAQFQQAGIPTGYIDMMTEREEREVVRRQLANGDIKVVTNVGCLTTGVDWDVRCIVLARPTKSEILFVQMVGRGLRPAPGKDHCLILDHSDNHQRLGFVTDIHHVELDDGKPKMSSGAVKAEALPKPCPSCTYLKPAHVHKCPSCGFEPTRQSTIQCAPGELVEKAPHLKPDGTPWSYAEKAEFFAGLRYYGIEKGRREGWAAYSFREKFGTWPDAWRHIKPQPPNDMVLSWIISRNIKFARSKKRAA